MIRQSICDAIIAFEPRIHSGSVDVQLRVGHDNRQSIVTYDIHADMWAQPMPMELYLRSEVDVTTGELALERVN
jgi:type VI secretion system protein ImpF